MVEETLAPILSADPPVVLVDLYFDSAPNTKLPFRRAAKSESKSGSEYMESSAVKHTDTCGRKVDLTQSFVSDQGKPAMLELGCERGGVHQDHKKKRYTSTDRPYKKERIKAEKCGCPFTLKGVWMEGDKWKVRVHCGAHNHELPETLVGHSDVARLKEDEKEILVDLTKSGVRHRVCSPLKQRRRENMSRMRTIYNYNASAAIKLTEVEG
ncbi:hypothetical protein MKW92_007908, partial [Papaver armeniacum]